MVARATRCLILLSACGRVGFDEVSRDSAGDGSLDSDVDPACATGPWGAPRPQLALRSTDNDWEPALHPDGLVLVFARQNSMSSDLWVATRATTSDDFDNPVPIPNAATPSTFEFGAMWSPDGTQLTYRYDDDPIYEVRTITHLGGTSFSSTFTLADLPAGSFSWDITPNELEVFYTTVLPSFDYNLGHATRASLTSPWVTDAAVDGLNQLGVSHGWPTYDAARGILTFEYDDPAAAILNDARRPSPGAPFQLVGNTEIMADRDSDPDLSADGLTLLFSSLRLGGGTNNDIFLATRSCL